jgi:hypothetical protein
LKKVVAGGLGEFFAPQGAAQAAEYREYRTILAGTEVA